jgi:hypothetical protein
MSLGHHPKESYLIDIDAAIQLVVLLDTWVV